LPTTLKWRQFRTSHFTEVGIGAIDRQGIPLATSRFTETMDFVVEQYFSKHPDFESAQINFKSFHKFRGVH
jgi:hypothetical protein